MQKAARIPYGCRTAFGRMSICSKNVFNSVKFDDRVYAKQKIAAQTQQIDIGLARHEHVVFDDLPLAPVEHLQKVDVLHRQRMIFPADMIAEIKFARQIP